MVLFEFGLDSRPNSNNTIQVEYHAQVFEKLMESDGEWQILANIGHPSGLVGARRVPRIALSACQTRQCKRSIQAEHNTVLLQN